MGFYYDLNGNVTRYDTDRGNPDLYFDYDSRNRLTRVTKDHSAATSTPIARDEFWYGPDDERVVRKASWEDTVMKYTWEVSLFGGTFTRVYPEHETAVTYRSKVMSGDSSMIRFVQYSSGSDTYATEYIHRDHLGSVDNLTSSAGNSIRNLSFEPYGEGRHPDWSGTDTSSDATLQNDLDVYTPTGFTGHEHLNRTGIIHMNGRVYDPALGRFLQPDPIVQNPGYSQNFNRYAYVFNNPLAFTDPSGFAARELDEIDGSSNSSLVVNGYEVFSGSGIQVLREIQRRSGSVVSRLPRRAPVLNPRDIQRPEPSPAPAEQEETAIQTICYDGICQILTPQGSQETADIAMEAEQAGVRLGGSIVVGGSTISILRGGASLGPRGGSILQEASDAAFRAADRLAGFVPKNKHLLGGGSQSKARFNTSDIGEVRALIQEALRSPNAQFLPNPNAPGTFRVVTDLGRQVGVKGQTSLRTIVGQDGKVINSFPVHTR